MIPTWVNQYGRQAGPPTLGVLSFSSTTFNVGDPSSGTIIGATPGSSINSIDLPPGLTINGTARTWSWSGVGTADIGTFTLIESLVGATNTPRNTVIPFSITENIVANSLWGVDVSLMGAGGPHRIYNNLARYSPWMIRGQYPPIAGSSNISAAGELLTMPAAGESVLLQTPRPSRNGGRFKVTWNGGPTTCNFQQFGDATFTLISNAGRVAVYTTDCSSVDPTINTQLDIYWTSTGTGMTPVTNVVIAECDDSNNYLTTDTFYPDGVAFYSQFKSHRWLDNDSVNYGTEGEGAIFPGTFDPAQSIRYPQNYSNSAKATILSGGNGLTLVAGTSNWKYNILESMYAMAAGQKSGVTDATFKTTAGAAGNSITVVINSPSGADPGPLPTVSGNLVDGLTLTFTPPASVTTLDKLITWLRGDDWVTVGGPLKYIGWARYGGVDTIIGSGSAPPVTTAGVTLTGGVNPARPGPLSIQDQVAFANTCGADLVYIARSAASLSEIGAHLNYIAANLIGKCYVSLSNENWNLGFYLQAGYIMALFKTFADSSWQTAANAAIASIPDDDKWVTYRNYSYAWRMSQICSGPVATAEALAPGKFVRVIENVQVGGWGPVHDLMLGTNGVAGSLGLNPYADQLWDAPYTPQSFISTGNKGQWKPGMNLTVINPGSVDDEWHDYVTDKTTNKAYYATTSFTTSSTIAADISAGNLAEMSATEGGDLDTMRRDKAYAKMLSRVTTTDNLALVVDNDKGNKPVIGSYEGFNPHDQINYAEDLTPSSITRSGTTCTVTTSATHGFIVGQSVTIYGANETAYNGTFTIATVPTNTTFTYTALSTPSASPATGTLRVRDEDGRAIMRAALVDLCTSIGAAKQISFAMSEDNRLTPNKGMSHIFNSIGPFIPYEYSQQYGNWGIQMYVGDAAAGRSLAVKYAAQGKFWMYDLPGTTLTTPYVEGVESGQFMASVPQDIVAPEVVNAISVVKDFVLTSNTSTVVGTAPWTPSTGDVGLSVRPRVTFTGGISGDTIVRLGDPIVVQAFTKTVVLTTPGSGTFVVPGDFNPANPYSVEIIGASGAASQAAGSLVGNGGGGGAYILEDRNAVLGLTAGASVSYQIAAGGSVNDTWFKSTSIALAKAGTNAVNNSDNPALRSVGGQASASVGRVKYSGGNGGVGGGFGFAAGGGGAAGPNGDGARGGNGKTVSGEGTPEGVGAGGGANGGSAPLNTPNNARETGLRGGLNRLGTGAQRAGGFDYGPLPGLNGAGGSSAAVGSRGSADQDSGADGSFERWWRDSTTGIWYGSGSGGGGASYNAVSGSQGGNGSGTGTDGGRGFGGGPGGAYNNSGGDDTKNPGQPSAGGIIFKYRP